MKDQWGQTCDCPNTSGPALTSGQLREFRPGKRVAWVYGPRDHDREVMVYLSPHPNGDSTIMYPKDSRYPGETVVIGRGEIWEIDGRTPVDFDLMEID